MQFKKELFQKNKFALGLILFLIIIFISFITIKLTSSQQGKLEVKQENHSINSSQKFTRKDKSVIRVCQNDIPPVSLDPIYFDNKLDEITFHIFDRLVKWNKKGQIVPDLAESWRQIDDKTTQFKLRRNVKFHNGETFNAQAVKFSLDRLLAPDTKSPGAKLFKNISKIEIIDPYTVNIINSQPDYLFIRKLSLVQILPPKYFRDVGEEVFSKKPVGTGAYEFSKWNKDGSIVLTKNPNYWVKGKPIINTVIFKFIEDDISKKEQRKALTDGKIDIITQLPGIHTLDVQKGKNTKVIKMLNQAKVHKMVFNSLKKPFSDIKIRKAVNIALNRDILIKVLAKGNGRKIATNSVKLEFGHNPNLKPYPYDPKLAKELLNESKYKDLTIKIAVTEDAKIIAQAIKKDLERINIQSEVNSMTISEMVKGLLDSKTWDYDLTIYSGVDPFMHVGFLYGMAVYSKGLWSKTNSKEVDEIYKKLEVTLDEEQQLKLCNKLEELGYNNYWYTPVFQVIGTYGAAKDVVLKDSATTFLDLSEAYFKDLEE
ncbi:MAG: ABC transporter substrate-binding protein [Cyanobacteriota bacterium]